MADFVVKILLLGETEVGKSTILNSYVEEKILKSTISTVGIDFKTKMVTTSDGKAVKVLLYDTAGQERFQSIARSYYHGIDAALFVFDISRKKTFEKIEFWLKDLEDNSEVAKLVSVIIENKIDLEDEREVKKEEIKNFANSKKMELFSVSGLTGDGVQKMFEKVILKIIKNKKAETSQSNQHGEKEEDNRKSLKLIGTKKKKKFC